MPAPADLLTDWSALTGIWGFPVTPFTCGGQVDVPSFREQVSMQVDGGVDVIVGAGILAELAALAPFEWKTVVRGTLEAVAGRVPVLITIPATFGQALESAAFAAREGASALLVLPPGLAGTTGLASYLRQVSDVSALGVVLYQRGRLLLEPSDIEDLVEVECLIGIKDGQRDLRRFRRLLGAAGERLLFAAAWEDLALPYWAMGALAFCPASTAHDPWYAPAWLNLLRHGDLDGARRLLEALAYPLTDLRLSRQGIEVAVVKAAMSVRGLKAGPVRPPALELTNAETRQLRSLLEAFDRTVDLVN